MYMKNMDGLLASNASHSMTLLQLVEYYHRKKTKMKYRNICTVLNQLHGASISERVGLNTSVKIKVTLRVKANDRNTRGQVWC